jgi:hypothetical protein
VSNGGHGCTRILIRENNNLSKIYMICVCFPNGISMGLIHQAGRLAGDPGRRSTWQLVHQHQGGSQCGLRRPRLLGLEAHTRTLASTESGPVPRLAGHSVLLQLHFWCVIHSGWTTSSEVHCILTVLPLVPFLLPLTAKSVHSSWCGKLESDETVSPSWEGINRPSLQAGQSQGRF